MNIIAGEQNIPIKAVNADQEYYNKKNVPSLRVYTDAPLTEEQITALLNNDWQLSEQNPKGEAETFIRRGYKAVHHYLTVFIQTETAEEREEALRQRIAELEAEKTTTEAMLSSLQSKGVSL